MNRIKDLLCGRAVPAQMWGEPTARLRTETEMLSCGGARVVQHEPHPILAEEYVLHLAKQHYEIMYSKGGNDWQRYGHAPMLGSDDLSLIEALTDEADINL